MATHGVLSGPAIDRLKNSAIERVVLTNTLPLPPEKQIDQIEVLSIAPLIAEALSRRVRRHAASARSSTARTWPDAVPDSPSAGRRAAPDGRTSRRAPALLVRRARREPVDATRLRGPSRGPSHADRRTGGHAERRASRSAEHGAGRLRPARRRSSLDRRRDRRPSAAAHHVVEHGGACGAIVADVAEARARCRHRAGDERAASCARRRHRSASADLVASAPGLSCARAGLRSVGSDVGERGRARPPGACRTRSRTRRSPARTSPAPMPRIRPPAADVVDGAGHVGQQLRVAVAVARRRGAELDAVGLLGPRREQRPALECLPSGSP